MNPQATKALVRLNQRMVEFYNSRSADEYYTIAADANAAVGPRSALRVLESLCRPGMEVLDLGCGSGHVGRLLAERSIRYTGVDWSVERIQRNAAADNTCSFLASSLYEVDLPSGAFDISASFYVLEHLVWPHVFLVEMLRLTKPGGILIIECPHFRRNHRIPSLRFGRRVAPLSQKLRQYQVTDALVHYVQRRWQYPVQIRKRFPADEYPFLINLDPSCLDGIYYPDNDAVYFVDRLEVVRLLERAGARDITEDVCGMLGFSPPVDPCLVVALRDS